jgi:hypothetical protein
LEYTTVTTVALPANSITADVYYAAQGRPSHVLLAALRPEGCPGCGGALRNSGLADWVSRHGIVVSLWYCLGQNGRCEAVRLGSDFRLETAVYPHPEEATR